MNAIYELVTRDARGPSVRVSYGTGVALGIVFTAYLTWEILVGLPQGTAIGVAVLPGAVVILLLFAPIVAAISGYVTANHARRIDFDLLRTTPLTPTQIAWGFLRGALYHNRVVLAIGLALIPLYIFGSLQSQLQSSAAWHRVISNCVFDCAIYRVIPGEFDWGYDAFVSRALPPCAWVVAFLISAVLASSIGVRHGLANHNKPLASAAASAASFFETLILPTVLFFVLLYSGPEGAYLQVGGIALLYVVIFFTLSYMMFTETKKIAAKLRRAA